MEIGGNSAPLWRAYRVTKRGEPIEFLSEASTREELERKLGRPQKNTLVRIYRRGVAVGYWPSVIRERSPKIAPTGASAL